jgi:hypothetical protein
MTILGIVIAALAMLAALPLHEGPGTGYVLITPALLLLAAGLVWRFGPAVHAGAAALGLWLLLTNGWYTFVNIVVASDGVGFGVGVFLVEAGTAIGGGITLLGAVRYLRTRPHDGVDVEGGPPPASVPLLTAPERGGSLRFHRWLAGVAIAVQLMLLFHFFVMGLGWGGFWYVANLGQAAILLVLALALLRKRPLLVLALPVASLLLMLAFQAVDPSLRTTECTTAELAAAAELPPPPGSPAPEFESEPENGCIARFNSTLAGDRVLDHYRQAAENAGWEVMDAGEAAVEPGEEPPTPGTGSLSLNKNGMRFELNFEPAGEESSGQNQSWVVISVY